MVATAGPLTYALLEAESRLLARGLLARGVGKGARIGLWLGNGTEWLVAWAAVCRIGAVAVPLSTFFSERELAKVVRHADLHGLFTHRRFLGQDMLERVVRALPELEGCAGPVLAVRDAPFLRWVSAFERPGDPPSSPPAWAAPQEWFRAAAEQGPFDDDYLERVEAEVHAEDPAIMIYTSGSTADPKGVPHVHDTVTERVRYLSRFFSLGPESRSYIASPFCWVGGMTMSLFPVLDTGGTQYCTDRFDAGELLELVERERLDRAVLYPHHVNAVLDHPDFDRRDRSSLRDCDVRLLVGEAAAAALRPDPDKLYIGLGMTETFDGYWWGRRTGDKEPPLRPGERRPPPLDVHLPWFDVKVVDPATGQPVPDGGMGEICVRGRGITPGLHKRPRAEIFDRDGFFHTGDRVEVDGDRIWFRGRLGEMIKTAGANVAPGEVVAALLELDGVADAHVVGIPDSERGEVVVAAVVPASGADLDPDGIRARLRTMVSAFKVPAHVVLLRAEEIPWTPSHKVRRGVLTEMLRERLGADPA